MLTIYLIRHGETDWNKGAVYQGHTDIPLGVLGRKQAVAVARRLAGERLDAVYASDLGRARETALAVAKAQNLRTEVICDRRLREIDVGLCAGKTRAESEAAFPEVFRAMRADPAGTCMPGGESFADLCDRVRQAVQEIAESRPGGKVALVSHGGTIRAILCLALGLPLTGRARLAVDNCSLSVISYAKGIWQAALVNDTCHLEGLDMTDSVEV